MISCVILQVDEVDEGLVYDTYFESSGYPPPGVRYHRARLSGGFAGTMGISRLSRSGLQIETILLVEYLE